MAKLKNDWSMRLLRVKHFGDEEAYADCINFYSGKKVKGDQGKLNTDMLCGVIEAWWESGAAKAPLYVTEYFSFMYVNAYKAWKKTPEVSRVLAERAFTWAPKIDEYLKGKSMSVLETVRRPDGKREDREFIGLTAEAHYFLGQLHKLVSSDGERDENYIKHTKIAASYGCFHLTAKDYEAIHREPGRAIGITEGLQFSKSFQQKGTHLFYKIKVSRDEAYAKMKEYLGREGVQKMFGKKVTEELSRLVDGQHTSPDKRYNRILFLQTVNTKLLKNERLVVGYSYTLSDKSVKSGKLDMDFPDGLIYSEQTMAYDCLNPEWKFPVEQDELALYSELNLLGADCEFDIYPAGLAEAEASSYAKVAAKFHSDVESVYTKLIAEQAKVSQSSVKVHLVKPELANMTVGVRYLFVPYYTYTFVLANKKKYTVRVCAYDGLVDLFAEKGSKFACGTHADRKYPFGGAKGVSAPVKKEKTKKKTSRFVKHLIGMLIQGGVGLFIAEGLDWIQGGAMELINTLGGLLFITSPIWLIVWLIRLILRK